MSVDDPFAFDHEPVLAADGRRFESAPRTAPASPVSAPPSTSCTNSTGSASRTACSTGAERLATLREEAGLQLHLPARRSGIVIASSSGTPHRILYDRLLAQWSA